MNGIHYVAYVPAAGGGNLLGLIVYQARDSNPSPSETVTTVPAAKRTELLARLTVSGEESFEAFAALDPMNGAVASANGVDGTFSTDAKADYAYFDDTNFGGQYATDGVVYASFGNRKDPGTTLASGLLITFSVPVGLGGFT